MQTASSSSVGAALRRLPLLLAACLVAAACSPVLDIVDREAVDLTNEKINACAPYVEAVGQSSDFFRRPIFALTLTSSPAGIGPGTPAAAGAAAGPSATGDEGREPAAEGVATYDRYLQTQYEDDPTRVFYLFSDLQLDIQQTEQARLRLNQALDCLAQESELVERKSAAGLVTKADAEADLARFRSDRHAVLDVADGIARDLGDRHARFRYAHHRLQPALEPYYARLRADLDGSATAARSRIDAARSAETDLARRTTVALADHWVSLQEFLGALAAGTRLSPTGTLLVLR